MLECYSGYTTNTFLVIQFYKISEYAYFTMSNVH